ncbi:MAG TPA: hypothetical protein VKS79_03850 [Gemmataceae bacterium]|nr:hypothetical protein [Gemmataceae bacterium]
MDFASLAPLANVPDPIIDFNHANALEIALWGVCISVSVICAGLALRLPGSRKRRLLLLAAVCFFIAYLAMTLHVNSRAMNDSIAKAKKNMEKSKEKQPPK